MTCPQSQRSEGKKRQTGFFQAKEQNKNHFQLSSSVHNIIQFYREYNYTSILQPIKNQATSDRVITDHL